MFAMAAKKTKGKQKMEMKSIENQEVRLVTFSKRWSSIYKKVSELVTLTGAEILFVVFSPAGNPFSFAHPSMEYVTNHFLGGDSPLAMALSSLLEARRHVRIQEQLDSDAKKGQELEEKLIENERKGWWDASIEELNLLKLIELENKFKTLHTSLCNEVIDSNNRASSSSRVPQSD